MSRESTFFPLGGGLDLVSQAIAVKSGRAIAAMNYEALSNGYARCGGFERYDGRAAPSAAVFSYIAFTGGASSPAEGATLTGFSSGATARVLSTPELTAGAWNGTGVGRIGLYGVTGTFTDGETLKVGGTTIAIANGTAEDGSNMASDAETIWYRDAVAYLRSLIQKPPGSGGVRGVWDFNGVRYAWRDNAGATAGIMYKSTTAGWVALTMPYIMTFTSGGTYIVKIGDTVTDTTGAKTALVKEVVVQSGGWSTGDAAGYLVIGAPSGAFVAENLNVGANLNVATIAAAPTQFAFPPGGRYIFRTHNFYGASNRRQAFGVNGVGYAFCWGTDEVVIPIKTSMPVDTPHRIAVHRKHLFLAFPGGSLQNSAVATPLSWEPVLGANEFGMGDEITDLIESNTNAMAVLSASSIAVLTGTSTLDFSLDPLTDEAGALPFTSSRFGSAIYLDNRGLRSIKATQEFGNFGVGTLSESVQPLLSNKREKAIAPVAATIIRTKDHYRLFFADGSGISFYMGRKDPEAMAFNLGKVITCISSVEGPDTKERIFFGSDDGYVYQLDVGTSFDGEVIEAFIQLPYNHLGTPRQLKQFRKAIIELVAAPNTQLYLTAVYDYSDDEQGSMPELAFDVSGGGGLWDIANWDEFYWSSPNEGKAEGPLEGQGANISLIIYSSSAYEESHNIQGITLDYSPRGIKR